MGVLRRIIDPNEREIARLRKIVKAVNAVEPEMERLTDGELHGRADHFRHRLSEGETLDDILPEAFAAVREAAKRVLGQRPFDVQVMGAIVLHQGKVAEMRTGEGKTLTATMPLYLNALTGRGAHLVTTNDFLVRWQAEWMGRIYEFLGLTVGYVQHTMDAAERRAMYNRDITYVENSELGFDYLRDNMAARPESLVLRDLHYAVVDEVDSILIDEARTPLIISGTPEQSEHFYEEINRLVARLEATTDQPEKGPDGKEVEPLADYMVDEKYHQVALTTQHPGRGQEKIEKALNIDNLEAPEYLEIKQAVMNSMKAHTLYQRDREYVVKEGEVIIVDELTGHLQPGRRYSDGLHQAIEAKENVRIQQARQTVATITYQNFFKLYDKIAGMTGTAKTEEDEFREVYGMPVVVVPTNKPVIRKDYPDVVYKTQEAKYRGIVDEIIEVYVREQPALVGSRSVAVSEYIGSLMAPDRLALHALVRIMQEKLRLGEGDLSKKERAEYQNLLRTPLKDLKRSDLHQVAAALGVELDPATPENLDAMLEITGALTAETEPAVRERYRRRLETIYAEGVPHDILNAKYHEEEGRIIAEAGRPGKVTIATNMAGRGVDIVLGGRPENPDEQFIPEAYEKVKSLGGLAIIGSERHESRRIDNQLRGRSGRQGDPGRSRFYVSLEDEVMRLFGPERFGMLMRAWPEEEPVEARMISKSIERAQEKVESMHFSQRKQVLKYDDVMNVQRNVIYGERRRVLEGEDIHDAVLEMVTKTVDGVVDRFASPDIHPEDWDLDSMYHGLLEAVPGIETRLSLEQVYEMDPKELQTELRAAALELYASREQAIGADLMRQIERSWLLRVIDTRWMQHLREMDYLREGIGLRAYGQLDPLIQYQKEAYDYFEELLQHIAEDMTKAMLLTEVVAEPQREQVRDLEATQQEAVPVAAAQQGAAAGEVEDVETPMTEAAEEMLNKPRTYHAQKEPGRNDPCPCGSGKKYKYCCMGKQR